MVGRFIHTDLSRSLERVREEENVSFSSTIKSTAAPAKTRRIYAYGPPTLDRRDSQLAHIFMTTVEAPLCKLYYRRQSLFPLLFVVVRWLLFCCCFSSVFTRVCREEIGKFIWEPGNDDKHDVHT